MTEWFADETFWIDFHDFLFPTDKFANAEEEINKIINLINADIKDILDLCCGPARHSVLLAKRGYNVTAVDKSKYLLARAKEYCKKEEVNIPLIERDMRDYIQPNSYDLVLNLFTSFGYFEDPNDDLKVVQNIYTNLRTSGKVILETMSKEILARIFNDTSSTILDNNVTIVQRHKIINNWCEIENEWILLKNNEYRSHKFKHRIFSALELKNIFEYCGFKNVRFYGNLDGSDYNNNAERLILLAEK